MIKHRLLTLCLLLASAWADGGLVSGARSAPTQAAEWSEADTALARSAFQLFQQDPSYGRVTDLLWEVYDKHDQVDLLLESLAAQAQANALATLLKGHILRRQGDLQAAVDAYDQFLQLIPDHPQGLRARAQLALLTNDPELSVKLLDRLCGQLPANDAALPEVLLELSQAHEAAGDRSAARGVLLAAVRARPDDDQLRILAARELARSGDLDAATVQFEILAGRGNAASRVAALTELARYLELDAEPEKATAVIWRVLDLTHHSAPEHQTMFERLVRVHEREQTLDHLELHLQHQSGDRLPSEPELIALAGFYRLTAQPEARLNALLTLTDRYSSTARELELAELLIQQDQRPLAAQRLDQALLENSSLDLVLARARLEILDGHRHEAMTRLRSWLEQSPPAGRPSAEAPILALAREFNLHALTREILNQRVERDPDDREALFALVAWKLQRNQDELAAGLLGQWVEQMQQRGRPEQEKHLASITDFLLTQQEWKLAERFARQRLEQSIDPAEAMISLAEVLAQMERTAEAENLLLQVMDGTSSLEDVTDLDERLHSLLLSAPAQPGDPIPEPGIRPAPADDPRTFFKLPPLPDDPSPDGIVRQQAPGVVRQATATARAAEQDPTPKNLYRAAWWALKSEDHATAMGFLRQRFFAAGELRAEMEPAFEKLLYEAARADQGNRLLVQRQLQKLRLLDPDNAFTYSRLEAENDLAMEVAGAEDRLRAQLDQDPNPLPVLETLTQHLQQTRRFDDIVALWQRVYRRADRTMRLRLIDRHARVLNEYGSPAEALRAQTDLITAEGNPALRRELFNQQLRLLSEITSGDEPQPAGPDFTSLRAAYEESARRQPLEPFFDEALAAILSLQGDADGAYQRMRRAYYKSDGDASRQQPLRDAALNAGDLETATYVQRQIVSDSATEDMQQWNLLISLLERQLRFEDADRARTGMEARFAAQAGALADLADEHEQRGRFDRAIELRRVLANLEPDNPVNQYRLADLLVRERRFAEAHETYERLWLDTLDSRGQATLRMLPMWQSPNETRGSAPGHITLEVRSDALPEEIADAVIQWLDASTNATSSSPAEPIAVRLRGLGQWSRLNMLQGYVAWSEWYQSLGELTAVERMWATAVVGKRPEVALAARELLTLTKQPEQWFGIAMAAWRGGGAEALIDWAAQPTPETTEPQWPAAITVAALRVVVADSSDAATAADLRKLVEHDLISADELFALANSYAVDQRYQQALTTAEVIFASELADSRRSTSVQDAIEMHGWAEHLGDTARQISYLESILTEVSESLGPQDSQGQFVGRDLFIETYRLLRRHAATDGDRERLDQQVLQSTGRLRDPLEDRLRKAVVMATQGQTDEAGDLLGDVLLTALGQGGLREMQDLRRRAGWQEQGTEDRMAGLGWESVATLNELLRNQGLNDLSTRALSRVDQVFGALHLGDEPPAGFTRFRHLHSLQRLHVMDWPEREWLVRELVAVDVNVHTRQQLADQLAVQGFHRESLIVFQDLVPRAASSVPYAEGLFDAAEASWDHKAALEYLERMFASGFALRPQGIREGYLRSKHATFLLMDGQVDRLTGLAFEGDPPTERERRHDRTPIAAFYMQSLEQHHRQQGDFEALERVQRRRLDFQPEDHDLLAAWADSMTRLGRTEQAIETVERAIATNPSVPTREPDAARAWLGVRYASGDEEKFIDLVRSMMEAESLANLESLARSLQDHDMETQALRVLDAAVRVAKPDRLRLTDLLVRRLACSLRLATNERQLGQIDLQDENAQIEWLWPKMLDLLRGLDLLGHSGWDQGNPQLLTSALAEWARQNPAAAGIMAGKLRSQLASLSEEDVRSGLAALMLTVLAPTTGEPVDTPVSHALARIPAIYPDLKAAAVTALHAAGLPHAALAAWADLDPTSRGRNWTEPLFLTAAVEVHGEEFLPQLVAESLRWPYPSSAFSSNLPEALEAIGRPDLAGSLFDAYLTDLDAAMGFDPVLLVRAVEFQLRHGEAQTAAFWIQRRGHQFASDLPRLVLDWWRLANGHLAPMDQRIRQRFAMTEAQWRELQRLATRPDHPLEPPSPQASLFPAP